MLPIIFGLSNKQLLKEEKAFFKACDPFGFILFARNIEDANQLKSLCKQLQELSNSRKIAILIDQEGGRVQRLRPPAFKDWPAPASFGEIYQKDKQAGIEACYQSNFQMAQELKSLGITVNCTPLLDLYHDEADKVIGDRSFGSSPDRVTALGEAVIRANFDANLTSIIKHIPGHGLALVDSHHALPQVDLSLKALQQSEFMPFKKVVDHYRLKNAPLPFWAMSAHIIYSSIDPLLPATLSNKVISEIIRKHIGFEGLLLSDDIGMKALSGTPQALSEDCLKAGCDLVLHCNGKLEEMEGIVEHINALQPNPNRDKRLRLL